MRKIKAIRQIEQHAKKGNVTAMFQLYQNYHLGIDVKDDVEKSEEYFRQCVEFIESQDEHENSINRLEINKIQLMYFRKFESLNVEFDKNLTVIIGGNGSGKTTIVESIAKVLGWIKAGIETEGKNASRIEYTDINNSCPHYADISSELSFGSRTKIKGTLSRAVKGAEEKKDSYVYELKLLADIFRTVNAKNEINLPIFAYYSVSRASDKVKYTFDFDKISDSKIESRIDAYNGTLDGEARLEDFVEWFLFLHNITRSSEELEHSKNLKEEILELEAAQLQVQSESSVRSVIEKILHGKRLEYQKLLLKTSPSKSEFIRQYDSVVSAIVGFVETISDIKVDRSSGRAEIKILNEGAWVNINQLSQGQRVMLGLVADLSRRMAILNPKMQNPLNGRGIVLIDEIELHLHPKWQQIVIPSLQYSFPNVQFILTTHSPHVLSTVDKQSIRILKEDGTVIIPEFQTKGVVSSDVLEQLMDTFSVPPVQEAEWVNNYMGYVEQGLQDTSDAKLLYAKLLDHFGARHPVMQQCDASLKLQSLKMKARSKFN